MRREKTNSEELETTSAEIVGALRTNSGRGRYTPLLRTPACATEQTAHSWLGSFELSLWTWTAWTTPTNATRRIHHKDTATTRVSLRDLYCEEIKR